MLVQVHSNDPWTIEWQLPWFLSDLPSSPWLVPVQQWVQIHVILVWHWTRHHGHVPFGWKCHHWELYVLWVALEWHRFRRMEDQLHEFGLRPHGTMTTAHRYHPTILQTFVWTTWSFRLYVGFVHKWHRIGDCHGWQDLQWYVHLLPDSFGKVEDQWCWFLQYEVGFLEHLVQACWFPSLDLQGCKCPKIARLLQLLSSSHPIGCAFDGTFVPMVTCLERSWANRQL